MDIKEGTTDEGLPFVEWTDKEFHPEDGVIWLAAGGVFLVGYSLSFIYPEHSIALPLGFLLIGSVVGLIAHIEFLRVRDRRRRCYLAQEGQGFLLVLQPNTRQQYRSTMPYEDLAGFATGLASEWFDRQKDMDGSVASDITDPHVLFAVSKDGRQTVFGSHVGDRDEVSKVHAKLIEKFITTRPLATRRRGSVA